MKREDVLEQLRLREPLFHRAEFGRTRADFENMMAPGFWEVGASGRVYSAEFVLSALEKRYSEPYDDAWDVTDFECTPIAPDNYLFEPSGLDPDGLARVLLSPRRKDRVLVAGAMFLQPGDGALVRLQGRLAKSPSFWVKNVDIVRSYQRIEGSDLPVALESKADLRLFGPATLKMTYVYSEVGGRPVRP